MIGYIFFICDRFVYWIFENIGLWVEVILDRGSRFLYFNKCNNYLVDLDTD